MKRMRAKTAGNQPYYVGAEIVVDANKEKEEVNRVTAKLTKFGSKAKQAQRWLKSFPPLNTPDGGEIKRIVLRLPIGYRERKDVIAQYKERGFTHENARFQMLSDHAGPANTLVYVAAEPDGSGGNPDKPNAEQPIVEGEPDASPVSHPVVDEDGSKNEGNSGAVNFVSED